MLLQEFVICADNYIMYIETKLFLARGVFYSSMIPNCAQQCINLHHECYIIKLVLKQGQILKTDGLNWAIKMDFPSLMSLFGHEPLTIRFWMQITWCITENKKEM